MLKLIYASEMLLAAPLVRSAAYWRPTPRMRGNSSLLLTEAVVNAILVAKYGNFKSAKHKLETTVQGKIQSPREAADSSDRKSCR